MVEILGGAMSGMGCANGSRTMISNGVFLNVFNIEHFVDLDDFYDELESLFTHVRSSKLAPGFNEILLPGEPEMRSAQRVEDSGINVDQRTWEQICEEGNKAGIDTESWQQYVLPH
jgi:uncharacterized oxidoreductase